MSEPPQMILDHFVVHIDDEPSVLPDLKAQLDICDVPFEPDWGKGTKGFKAANIWIGRQYFEIVRILSSDGGGWTSHWVERHRQGQRGLYCIFLKVDRLDELARKLRAAGIAAMGPERITFRALFGLMKKSTPWRVLYLPPIPGTHLEFGFIDYDPDPKDRLKAYMTPNADQNGVTGVTEAHLRLPLTEEVCSFLQHIFPAAKFAANALTIPLATGLVHVENADYVHADFYAQATDADRSACAVTLENVTLHV